MDTNNYQQLNEDYLRVEQAIQYLESHYREQPELQEIAGSIGLSEYHFQRLFTRWVAWRRPTVAVAIASPTSLARSSNLWSSA